MFDWVAFFRDHPGELDGTLSTDEVWRRYWAYDPMVVAQARFRARWRRDVVKPAGRRAIDIAWRLTKGMR